MIAEVHTSSVQRAILDDEAAWRHFQGAVMADAWSRVADEWVREHSPMRPSFMMWWDAEVHPAWVRVRVQVIPARDTL